MAPKQNGKDREVSAMAPAQTTSLRVLLCLIEGDSTVFQVKAPINNNVLDLKGLIREQRKHGVLSSVDAPDLVLWKVSTTSTIASSHSRAEAVAYFTIAAYFTIY
jgi:Crinkler effector protein N-terminal domain